MAISAKNARLIRTAIIIGYYHAYRFKKGDNRSYNAPNALAIKAYRQARQKGLRLTANRLRLLVAKSARNAGLTFSLDVPPRSALKSASISPANSASSHDSSSYSNSSLLSGATIIATSSSYSSSDCSSSYSSGSDSFSSSSDGC